MNPVDEIQAIVHRLNDAWLNGRVEELAALFHPGVVVVAPGLAQRVAGREACVQSYVDFVSQAVVHRFEAEPAQVDVLGPAAVAVCPYAIEYEIGGKRWRGAGHDLLVLVDGDQGWTIAWRLLLPGAEEEVGMQRPEPPSASARATRT